jgi:hypothetical protein
MMRGIWSSATLLITALMLAGGGSTVGTNHPALVASNFPTPEVHETAPGWSEDIALSPAGYGYRNGTPSIGINGDNIHIFKCGSIGGTNQIYYTRSIDGGRTWDKNELFTQFDGYSNFFPDLAVVDNTIHVVYENWSYGMRDVIVYRKSIDNGETWSNETAISPDDGFHSMNVHIAASGQNVHVVWEDDRNGNSYNVFYKRSLDGGNTWDDGLGNIGYDRQLSFINYWSDMEGADAIAVSGNHVHILSTSIISNNVRHAMYHHSPDNGATWLPEVEIGSGPVSVYLNGIQAEGSNVQAIMSGGKDGNEEIYYRKSIDNGTTWLPETRLTNDPNISTQPDIAGNGTHVFVLWMDDRDKTEFPNATTSQYELYFKESFDGGTSWGPDTRLTYAANASTQPRAAMDSARIHVAWGDYRYNGTTWNQAFYKRYPDFPESTFEIPVVLGWNLVSLPLVMDNTALPEALLDRDGDTLWDRAMVYDPSDPDNRWKQYNANWNPGLGDMTSVDHLMGIWLNVTSVGDGFINVSGEIPTATRIQLRAGWTLVGYPTLCGNMTAAEAFWGTGVDIVEAFDANATYRMRGIGPTYTLRPGEGYWVHVVADSVWTVDW